MGSSPLQRTCNLNLNVILGLKCFIQFTTMSCKNFTRNCQKQKISKQIWLFTYQQDTLLWAHILLGGLIIVYFFLCSLVEFMTCIKDFQVCLKVLLLNSLLSSLEVFSVTDSSLITPGV